MMMTTKIMRTSENMVQIKNGSERTFYASCPSELGEKTKKTQREDLGKDI